MAKESFNDIINSDKPVVIDFFAEWCGPCKAMQPELQKLSTVVDERARIVKIDVDKNPQVSQVYQIRGVPTVMIFKKGKMEYRQAGFHSADQLLNILNRLM
jgi:thioredoxin 1